MASKDINIKINLQGIQKFSSDLKTAGTNLKQLGREIGYISKNITFVGASFITPLAVAFKSAQSYSLSVSREMERLNNVFTGLNVSIAEAMLPTVNKFTTALANLTKIWTDLDSKTKESIVNFALWSGGILVVVGVLGMFIGNLITVSGVIASLISKMAILSGATMPQVIVAIAGIIAVMVVLEKMGISVANVFEIAFKGMGVIVSSVIVGISQALIDLIGFLEKTLNVLSYLPSVLGALAKEAKGSLGGLKEGLQGVADTATKVGEGLAQDLGKAFSGNSKWETDLDNMILKMKQFQESLGKDVHIQKFKENIDGMELMATKTAGAMESAFSEGFFKVFTGETVKLKNVFADFGRSMMQIISQIIAKLIITKMLSAIHPAFNLISFHQGGIVKKAHSGMLARDEVPIIAQSGEGIISRKGMRALGEQGFNRLNKGNVESSGSQPILIIKAWDFADIYKNRKAIEGIIENAMATNAGVRRTTLKYT